MTLYTAELPDVTVSVEYKSVGDSIPAKNTTDQSNRTILVTYVQVFGAK